VLNTALFPSPPAKVVDIGCGHGAMAEAISQAGWQVIAVDEALELLDALRGRTAVPSCLADAVMLPFSRESLDGVIAMEVMEHLRDPAMLAHELVRVLRRGGAALVTVPTGYTERVYRRLNHRYWSTTTHQRTFTRRELTEVLEAAGLRVREVHTVGFDAAFRWFVHAILRSDFDFTGTILEHRRLDQGMTRAFTFIGRYPISRKALGALGRIVGKSYYAYCIHDG
jgi:2-polyprenyl-3-methyl-5-hydroxy-6-metoxy-1,4-benzoquinol methylase